MPNGGDADANGIGGSAEELCKRWSDGWPVAASGGNLIVVG